MKYARKPYNPLAWRWAFAWLPEDVSATEWVWLEWYQWRPVDDYRFYEYKTNAGVWRTNGLSVGSSDGG